MKRDERKRIMKSIAIINDRSQQTVEEFKGVPAEIVIKIFCRGVEAGQSASNEAFGIDF